MFTVTIEAADMQVTMNSEFEFAALERLADLLLWVVVSNMDHYCIALTKDGEEVTRVSR